MQTDAGTTRRQYPQRKHVSYRKQDLRGSQELPELRQLRGKQDIYSTQDLVRAIAAGLRDWIFGLRLFGYRMRAARQARQFGRAIHGQENQ